MTGASAGVVALAGVLGYAIGSVSPAALIARARHVDLRHSGSGNPGATNAGRVMGRSVGVTVFVLDVLKGLLPTLLAAMLWSVTAALVAGLFAVLGHCTSPWLKGHGGKGVATSFGAILGVEPGWALLAIAVFAVAFLLTRWVALSSVLGSVAVLVAAGWTWVQVPDVASRQHVVWAAALVAIVVFRHRSNLLGWRDRPRRPGGGRPRRRASGAAAS